MNVDGGEQPSPDICRQAVFSRDARFDGRFFAGAVTTRVYCRPTCPVPFARPGNLVWFRSAAEAERSGFRACQRCRSAASPGSPAWFGTSAVVSRALRLIGEGALDCGNVESLADRVGLGPRQLRRLFVEHLGAPPARIAITRRVYFARHLIEETQLPIAEVAACAGFRSIRQFNHAMRTIIGESPTELRRIRSSPRPSAPGPGLVLRLLYHPPLNWTALLAFLGSRAVAGVEFIGAGVYRRTIEIAGSAGVIEVRHHADQHQLLVNLELPRYDGLMNIAERLRRMFDLAADPRPVAEFLSQDPLLRPLLAVNPGLRVPGVWDGFEAALRAVLGERLMDQSPGPALARIARRFGKPFNGSTPGLTSLFPAPQDLAEAELAGCGLSMELAGAVRALAKATLDGRVKFDASTSFHDMLAGLRAVTEIMPSTAEYIALRAFGEPDAFPLPHGSSDAEGWRPWRAYAAMHLWRAGNSDV